MIFTKKGWVFWLGMTLLLVSSQIMARVLTGVFWNWVTVILFLAGTATVIFGLFYAWPKSSHKVKKGSKE